jgi:hypothetical protein
MIRNDWLPSREDTPERYRDWTPGTVLVSSQEPEVGLCAEER